MTTLRDEVAAIQDENEVAADDVRDAMIEISHMRGNRNRSPRVAVRS